MAKLEFKIRKPLPDDPAKLLFSRSIETDLGVRDIRVYWGDLASRVWKDSVVIISTNSHLGDVQGKAWDSLQAKYHWPESFRQGFLEVVRRGPESALWQGEPTEGLGTPPAILVSSGGLTESATREDCPRRVFVARTLRASESGEGDYRKMVESLFPAIKAVESAERITDKSFMGYGHIVMTVLAGRQNPVLEVLFRELVDLASEWLVASPRWNSVDLVCWKSGVSAPEAREKLLKAVGEEKIREPDLSLGQLFGEVRGVLDTVRETFAKYPHKKASGSADLKLEMDELGKLLGRGIESVTVREVGTAAGRHAEFLVQWLAKEFDKGIALKKDFAGNIELIGENKEGRQGWVAQWFKSYLHTLRILRNKSAHSSQAEEDRSRMLPMGISDEDLTVLLASLKQVLKFHLSWMEGQTKKK